VFGYGVLFIGGLSVGLLSLVAYERMMARSAARSTQRVGPGAMSAVEADRLGRRGVASWSSARQLALMIAIGIGLHNFAEGLAIGQSAAAGEVALATLLVIGFGLHNATEGFGIVAPLAAESAAMESSSALTGGPAAVSADFDNRPSWRFLLLMGAIGGGPTILGTLIGHGFTSAAVSVLFLTLAAGSILYVVMQLLGVAAKAKRPDLLAYGLLIGLVAGFVTDAVVTAAGA
jgi:ZIP family zinc transporter